jgi:uncharacterized protein (TIGR00369 family)
LVFYRAGALCGGVLSLFADYTMLAAVQSTQPPGTSWATLDLNVRFLRPLSTNGLAIRAHGRVVHRGRRPTVVNCKLTQQDERPAVLADSLVLLLPHRPWRDLRAMTDEPAQRHAP